MSWIERIFVWLGSFFKFVLTGKPSRPTKTYPREQHESVKDFLPPVPSPQETQAELYIETDVPPEYRKNKSVLTYRERALYRVLRRANDNEFAIMVKVRMGDFIYLANFPINRKFHANQVLCKHVDFLLCDKATLEPLLVVELDDSSHKRQDHIERDKFKDSTFLAVGLPVLRIELQQEYDWQSLQQQIKEKIGERPIVPNWE